VSDTRKIEPRQLRRAIMACDTGSCRFTLPLLCQQSPRSCRCAVAMLPLLFRYSAGEAPAAAALPLRCCYAAATLLRRSRYSAATPPRLRRHSGGSILAAFPLLPDVTAISHP